MRTAFSSMAWNTGSNSPGELEMTRSTSEVAVCCSSASVSSRVRACTSSNSRTFSIAITAWSAKVVISSICFSVKGRTVVERDTEQGAKAAEPLALKVGIFGVSQNIGDVNDLAFDQRSSHSRSPVDAGGVCGQEVFVFARVSEGRFVAPKGPLRSGQCSHIGLAQPGGGLDERLEHAFEIE